MTTYTISSESEWNNFTNDPLSSGDIIQLTGDIIFTAEPTKVIDIDAGEFDGQNYTITLPSSTSSFLGLMDLGAGTVKNLRLNVESGASIASGVGWIVSSNSSGTIQRCTSNGNASSSNSAGIVGSSFTGIVEYCISTGNVTGQEAGGVVSNNFSGIARYCYCSGDITGTRAGGIAGVPVYGVSIYECISFSTTVDSTVSATTSGAIMGYYFGGGTVTIIDNCYALAGPLVGYTNALSSGTTTITIQNSYTLGTYIINYMNWSGGGTLTWNVNDCVYDGGANFYGTNLSGAWTTNSNGDTSNSLADIDQLLFTAWSTDTWTAGDSVSNQYPSLDDFTNSENWTGYDTYDTAPTLTDGGSSGDPHVTTLLNQKYDYDIEGYSRYFNTLNKDLVINCLVEQRSSYMEPYEIYFLSLHFL